MSSIGPSLISCIDQATFLSDGCRAAMDCATGDLGHKAGLTWIIDKLMADADRLVHDLEVLRSNQDGNARSE